ncbi:hypothetical protein [Corynebacterium lactis]|uniref:Uncharacterized protein n=1 Tax=Corynebacterium lactis RW2-5 TaxID=1408189 RepID=A0A0K2H446_9CORY|nr:hypothetical protein [Corynebacterium lactis]ALA68728.1 hypothetical protein CLAC_11895 [Corynebacterium lactis RW2-5]
MAHALTTSPYPGGTKTIKRLNAEMQLSSIEYVVSISFPFSKALEAHEQAVESIRPSAPRGDVRRRKLSEAVAVLNGSKK